MSIHSNPVDLLFDHYNIQKISLTIDEIILEVLSKNGEDEAMNPEHLYNCIRLLQELRNVANYLHQDRAK